MQKELTKKQNNLEFENLPDFQCLAKVDIVGICLFINKVLNEFLDPKPFGIIFTLGFFEYNFLSFLTHEGSGSIIIVLIFLLMKGLDFSPK